MRRNTMRTAWAILLVTAAPAWAGRFTYTKLNFSPLAIDNSDRVVGYTGSGKAAQGMTWVAGTTTAVPGASELTAINANGIAAGTLEMKRSKYTFVTYDVVNNVLTRYAPPKGNTYIKITSINDANSMTAYYRMKGMPSVYYDGYEISYPTFTQVVYPNALSTIASSINDSGVLVGSYFTGDTTHGFSLQNGTYTSFDPPGVSVSGATGITNDGTIYGYYHDSSGALNGYVLQNGSYTTVRYPGSLASFVVGVGPNGEVVGNYAPGDGKSRAYDGFVLVGGTYYPIGGTPKRNTGLTGVNALGSIIGHGAAGYYIAQCPSNQFPCTK
jgi:hypothetical protein